MKLQMFGSRSLKSKSDLKKVSIPTGSETKKEEDIWETSELDALCVPILGSGSDQEEDEGFHKPKLLNAFGVDVANDAEGEPPVLSVVESEEIPILEEPVFNAEIDEGLDAVLDEEFITDSDGTVDEDLVGDLVGKILEDVVSEVLDEKFNETLNEQTAEESMIATLPSFEVEEETELLVEAAKEVVIGVYASSELYVKSLERELSNYGDAKIHCFDSSMNEAQLRDDSAINLWIVNLSDDDESELLDSILDISADHPTLYLSGSLTKHCKNRIKEFLEEN